jgi:hypothetical protein
MTKKQTKKTPAPTAQAEPQAEPQAAPAPKAAPKDGNLTLERQRVVNALISAAALRVGEGPHEVILSEGERYAPAATLVTEVSAALGVTTEIVRLALESAVQQGLLVVPPGLPVSEHPIIAVRPGTL